MGGTNLKALWRSHLTSVKEQYHPKFVSWHIDQAFKIELEIMKICGHLSTHMLSLRIYLQNDQKWIINNDYGPFGHHFLVCPEIKKGVTLKVGKPNWLHFTVIELSFKILSLYLSVPNKWTKIVKIHEPYKGSMTNVQQFLLNLFILSSLKLYRNVFCIPDGAMDPIFQSKDVQAF